MTPVNPMGFPLSTVKSTPWPLLCPRDPGWHTRGILHPPPSPSKGAPSPCPSPGPPSHSSTCSRALGYPAENELILMHYVHFDHTLTQVLHKHHIPFLGSGPHVLRGVLTPQPFFLLPIRRSDTVTRETLSSREVPWRWQVLGHAWGLSIY